MTYGSLCDDFYINMNLCTEMELPQNRETVLEYLGRVQKQFPTMRNFYCRDKGDFVLEEDKDGGQYRWTTIETRRVCSGMVNPDDVDRALEQHRLVLELAPYYLAVSPLDCEALDLLYGFDFTYRGNHNQLVAEALGMPAAFERLSEVAGHPVISYEPGFQVSLDAECRTQMRVSVETRTNAYQVRTGDFPEEQISVYITARKYGSLGQELTFAETLDYLSGICREMVDSHVIEHLLQPLARTISLK